MTMEPYLNLEAFHGQYARRPALAQRLLTLMWQGHAGAPARLRQNVAASDLQGLAEEAHRVKGALVNLCPTSKMLYIATIEQMAKAGNPLALQEAAAYAQTLDEFMAELAAYLARPDGADPSLAS